jgi:thiopeptide-type bacteriocin biosynthesis protein
VRRFFPPGSEWLYAKLYTGTSTADHVLCEAVGPLVARVISGGLARGWFFIRYGDPEWHLRLRFRGEPTVLQAQVLPLVHDAVAAMLEDGRVWRLVVDTYRREVERYGGTGAAVALSEAIFQADSEAVLAMVETFQGDAGLDARWRLTLCGMHMLLEDLDLDLESRLEVMRAVRASFGREFRVDQQLRRQLGSRYRTERRAIEAMIAGEEAGDAIVAAGMATLRRRSERIAPLAARMKDLWHRGEAYLSLAELAPSLVHMYANRMLRSAARAQELVMYDLLSRLYASQAAVDRG